MEFTPDDKVVQEKLSEKIKEVRYKTGLSLRKISHLTGYKPGSIDNWENKRRPVNMNYVKKLALVCLVKEESLTDPFAKIEYMPQDLIPQNVYQATIFYNQCSDKDQKAFLHILKNHRPYPFVDNEEQEKEQEAQPHEH